MATQTLVEIGSGIGRMTASFTRLFAKVVACDLDAAFLERCRETVAQFGVPERLQTSHVADGRTLAIGRRRGRHGVQLHHVAALPARRRAGAGREAVRVTEPGGHIALNFRTWTGSDVVLWPAGKIDAGAVAACPGSGPAIAQASLDRPARLAGQPPVADRGAWPPSGPRLERRADRPIAEAPQLRDRPAPPTHRSKACTAATGGSSPRVADVDRHGSGVIAVGR